VAGGGGRAGPRGGRGEASTTLSMYMGAISPRRRRSRQAGYQRAGAGDAEGGRVVAWHDRRGPGATSASGRFTSFRRADAWPRSRPHRPMRGSRGVSPTEWTGCAAKSRQRQSPTPTRSLPVLLGEIFPRESSIPSLHGWSLCAARVVPERALLYHCPKTVQSPRTAIPISANGRERGAADRTAAATALSMPMGAITPAAPDPPPPRHGPLGAHGRRS
jgi:hypothetical protein